ncbi:hypothetical protein RAA17_13100 [Komagataeibacter rhaeticus]|nr:hypothetical protein [Komagataeibacter rhaeticus]
MVLKLLRHLHPGIHPEAEMTAFLTRHGAPGIAPYLGDVTHIDATGTPHVLAIAEGFMPNQGDGWSWSVNYLRATATDLALSGDEAAEDRADHIAFFHRLGLRLGGMHALLARPVADAAFAPQAATPAIVQGWVADIRAGITAALDSLEHRPDPPQPDMRALATRLCAERARLLERVEELARGAVGTLMTRIHGDFHLGQVLVVENDVVIIDFEGQPMVPLAERRARHSPLRDVAGLLRSIAYAVETARLDGGETGSHPGAEQSAARSSAYVTAFGEEADRIFLEGWKSGMGMPWPRSAPRRYWPTSFSFSCWKRRPTKSATKPRTAPAGWPPPWRAWRRLRAPLHQRRRRAGPGLTRPAAHARGHQGGPARRSVRREAVRQPMPYRAAGQTAGRNGPPWNRWRRA